VQPKIRTATNKAYNVAVLFHSYLIESDTKLGVYKLFHLEFVTLNLKKIMIFSGGLNPAPNPTSVHAPVINHLFA